MSLEPSTAEANSVKTDATITWCQLIMEFFGTFTIVYTLMLAHVQLQENRIDYTGYALANFCVIGFMVYCGANISGGHYNVSVSIALVLTKHVSERKFMAYIASQFCGSILAGVMMQIYKTQVIGKRLDYGDAYPHSDLKNWPFISCFIMEMISTYLLVYMYYSTIYSISKPKTEIYGLAIGAVAAFSTLTIGPITGACLNPWRVIGPAAITFELFTAEFGYAWVYYIGCTTGAILAGLNWNWFMKNHQFSNELKIPVNGLSDYEDNENAEFKNNTKAQNPSGQSPPSPNR